MLSIFIWTLGLITLLSFLFFSASKMMKSDYMMYSSFESGYNSNFFSRFSFSIHYFFLGLIFLFLDLELCLFMPFFTESVNTIKMSLMLIFFCYISLMNIINWMEK